MNNYYSQFSNLFLRRVLRASLWLAVAALCFASPLGAAAAGTAADRIQRHDRSLAFYQSGEPLVRQESASFGAALATASVADLRVSESVSPATFAQANASICALGDGSLVVSWEDYREGSGKIFLQKYSAAGSAIGANVKVAERTDGYNLIEPQVVATISGKFYLAYRDEAAGEIRCARFNGNLTVDIPAFVASDTTGFVYAGPFCLASRLTGGATLVYESYGSVAGIRGRRFLPDGSPNGSVFTVNSGVNSAQRWSPSVIYDEDGGFGVAWEDYTSGGADVYFRRFDSLGQPLTADVNLIDVAARPAGQFLPSLVYSPIHGFVAAWTDTRDGWRVFLQRYSKQIGLVGANLLVSPATEGVVYSDPALATAPSGLLTATFCSYAFTVEALAQRFDASLAPIGAPRTVNQLSGAVLSLPAAAIGSSGKYGFAWTAERHGLTDIEFIAADASLNPLQVSEQVVNNDAAGALSDQPALALVNGGAIFTAFRDQRGDAGDIYIQQSTLDGALIGGNVRINQDTLGGIQSDPSLAGNSLRWAAAWLDERMLDGVGGSRVFLRYGWKNGALLSDELIVSGSHTGPKATPQVVLAENGYALVCWVDLRSGSPQIYAHLIDDAGDTSGSAFAVSNSGVDKDNTQPSLSVDAQNRFTISWLDRVAAGQPRITVKRYNSSGAFQASATFVSDQPNTDITDFAGAVDSAGLAHILWRGVDSAGNVDLFLTRLTIPGGKTGPTTAITDNVDAFPVSPTLSVDGAGNILMAWVDSRTAKRSVFYQVFDASLSPQGGNQPFS
ncbi:MAG TPA: hypothetical protein VLB27_04730, partial [candidate division Zixibacteria bacterium]|nr:hypothetical protein [candidate division Zixibacteria bacterium]